MLAPLLILIAAGNLGLLIRGITQVRGSADRYTFIYGWGALIGAFVWEDVIVFSAFFMLAALLTLLVRDIRIGLVLLLVFWIVRGAGEALYMFLQQFLRPSHPPHNIDKLFHPLRTVFGPISTQKCFIIMQIFWQVITVTAASGLLVLLLNWHAINPWR